MKKTTKILTLVFCISFTAVLFGVVWHVKDNSYKYLTYNRFANARLMLFLGADVNAKGGDENETVLMRALRLIDAKNSVALLLSNSVDINATDNDGDTALMYAFRYGKNHKIIKQLLEYGADVNARNKEGDSPLLSAVGLNRTHETIKLLLDKGAGVNVQDKYGNSALIKAVRLHNNPNVTKLLIERGADVNATDKDSNSVLRQAKASVFDMVLDAGAEINFVNKGGITNFMAVCAKGSAKTVKRMSEEGVDIKAKDNSGKTPFIYAASYNKNIEVLELLLKLGADVNESDKSEKTALMYAVENNQPLEIIRSLISKNADINKQSKYGLTALKLAIEKKRPIETAELLINKGSVISSDTLAYAAAKSENPDIIDLLLSNTRGEVRSDIDSVVLCEAISGPRLFVALDSAVEIAKRFVKLGINPNVQCDDISTPIMRAARVPKLVEILLENGADVNFKSSLGITGLMYASNWVCDRCYIYSSGAPNFQAMKTMLEHGADPSIKDNDGRTALNYALECDWRSGNQECTTDNSEAIELLKAAGAKE